MANFKQINSKVHKEYPHLDIEVVRGKGYVYFSGEDGFDKLRTIYAHPTSTSTEDMLKLVMNEIDYRSKCKS